MRLQDFDFRVWDTAEKCYLYAHTIGGVSEKGFYACGLLDNMECLRVELGIGFKDKKGKQMFENDIVLWRGQKAVLKFDKFDGVILKAKEYSEPVAYLKKICESNEWKNIEIIGNASMD